MLFIHVFQTAGTEIWLLLPHWMLNPSDGHMCNPAYGNYYSWKWILFIHMFKQRGQIFGSCYHNECYCIEHRLLVKSKDNWTRRWITNQDDSRTGRQFGYAAVYSCVSNSGDRYLDTVLTMSVIASMDDACDSNIFTDKPNGNLLRRWRWFTVWTVWEWITGNFRIDDLFEGPSDRNRFTAKAVCRSI